MADIIYVNKEMMEEMRRHFVNGAEELDAAVNQINQISNELADDGLIGDAGTAFTEALTGILIGKITEIRQKFTELSEDILFAVRQMDEADDQAEDNMGY
ncbi:MAG: WXG100 family type VII secretion target [Anaerolineae bacterium]|nr:WXG100 family type VII secretion target [Anaerolineae bacterium]